MSTNTKLAQAAGQEPYTREQHFALREAHCIAAGDAYFEVRPHLDAYGQRRSAFDDGFARGFDKGTELAEARAADRAAHESLAAYAAAQSAPSEQAQQSELASILARLEAVPLPGPTHEWLRGLRTQQELEDLRAAMLAAAKGVME